MIVRSLLAIAFVFSGCGGRAGTSDGDAGAAGWEGKVQEAGHSREAEWTNGEACIGGSAISYLDPRDAGSCLVRCDCQATGRLQCTTDCTMSYSFPPRPECAEGMPCIQEMGSCGQPTPDALTKCVSGCACDKTAHYRCVQVCPNDCGLFTSFACGMCADGKPSCGHFVIYNGYCATETCPEDGPAMGL